jgi:hypothetical protein
MWRMSKTQEQFSTYLPHPDSRKAAPIDHPEYAPDCIAKIESCVLMLETKSQSEMTDTKMQAKANAAVKRCGNASDYLMKNGDKTWEYLLILHDEIKENHQLEDYAQKFEKI